MGYCKKIVAVYNPSVTTYETLVTYGDYIGQYAWLGSFRQPFYGGPKNKLFYSREVLSTAKKQEILNSYLVARHKGHWNI